MYNNKTTKALKFIIKLCYIGLAILIVGLWYITKTTLFEIMNDGSKAQYVFYPTLLSILAPFGYVALAFIDKLLSNVKNDKVFESSTLKYLDVISYDCVIVSIIVAVSLAIFFSKYGLIIFSIIALAMLALGAMFMALILKVIKKVFAKAIELKEENDLTI